MPAVTRSGGARGCPPRDAATVEWDGTPSPSTGKAEAAGASVNPPSNPRPMPLAAATGPVPPQEEQAHHRGPGLGPQQSKRRQQSTWDLDGVGGALDGACGRRACQLLLLSRHPVPLSHACGG